MIAITKASYRLIGSSIALAALSACGASSDVGKCYASAGICNAVGVVQSVPQPPVYATGLYKGVTSNGREVAGVVLDDNSFYAIYSGVNSPCCTGGAVQGTVRAEAGSFSVTDAVDVNIEGLGTQLASVSGTYGQKQFINGTIVYPASSQTVTFSANYSADYENTPTLSAIAGTFAGKANTVKGAERITFSISATGDLSGSGTSGCTFSGTVTPRSSGNVYVTTIQLGAAPCAMPGATLTGISYFDRTTGLDYTVASAPGPINKLIVIATKQ
jgi:hypothetical protein